MNSVAISDQRCDGICGLTVDAVRFLKDGPEAAEIGKGCLEEICQICGADLKDATFLCGRAGHGEYLFDPDVPPSSGGIGDEGHIVGEKAK